MELKHRPLKARKSVCFHGWAVYIISILASKRGSSQNKVLCNGASHFHSFCYGVLPFCKHDPVELAFRGIQAKIEEVGVPWKYTVYETGAISVPGEPHSMCSQPVSNRVELHPHVSWWKNPWLRLARNGRPHHLGLRSLEWGPVSGINEQRMQVIPRRAEPGKATLAPITLKEWKKSRSSMDDPRRESL